MSLNCLELEMHTTSSVLAFESEVPNSLIFHKLKSYGKETKIVCFIPITDNQVRQHITPEQISKYLDQPMFIYLGNFIGNDREVVIFHNNKVIHRDMIACHFHRMTDLWIDIHGNQIYQRFLSSYETMRYAIDHFPKGNIERDVATTVFTGQIRSVAQIISEARRQVCKTIGIGEGEVY